MNVENVAVQVMRDLTQAKRTGGAEVGCSKPEDAPRKFSLSHVDQAYRVGGEVRKVLEDITLDGQVNETIAIIGPTGTGKSTLLRLLAGFEAPASGTVTLWTDGGEHPAAPSPRIGYLFQQPALFPWMSVWDNVIFGARESNAYGNRAELSEAAQYYLRKVGLQDACDLFPYQISGGMKARTALARVFLTKPELLLMDESFGALDALTRRDMYQLLRDLMASSPELTTLIVTHDVDEAISLCGTIIIIAGSPGRLSAVYSSGLSGMDLPISELQRQSSYLELKAELINALAKRKSTSGRGVDP